VAVQTLSDDVWPEVLSSPLPVLVGFWAAWCLPSHGLAATLEAADERLEGRAAVGSVDVDRNPELARRYGVLGLPTLLLIEGGEVTLRRVGLLGREDLLALLASRPWS